MSKKRSNSFFSRNKEEEVTQHVHSDLAIQIIEMEMELEKSWDVKIIHELMALYTKAVEYYEQNNNPKFYDFQDRMHKMLIRPQVIASLQKENCPDIEKTFKTSTESLNLLPDKVSLSIETEEILNSNEVPRKIEKFQHESLIEIKKSAMKPPKSPSHMDTRKAEAEITRKFLSKELSKTLSRTKKSRKLDIIIERQNSTSKESAHKAAIDFKSQESTLERRIASRRVSNVNKSLTLSYHSTDLSKVSVGDLSDLSEENNTSTKSSFFVDEQRIENYEKFEKRLEAIMEKSFSEKAAKIAEVKFKYENQMSEIAGMGDFMDMLVKQMRANMQEEINSINIESDAKRKEDIRKLKEGLL